VRKRFSNQQTSDFAMSMTSCRVAPYTCLAASLFFAVVVYALPARAELLSPGSNTTNLCTGTADNSKILAAAAKGIFFELPSGACRISSNLTISAAVAFQAGSLIKPDRGVTVAFSGPVAAPISPICDVSAGGHCDFRKAKTPYAVPEWWGAVGGDDTFNAANAKANTLPINEMLIYAPNEIRWTNGAYSMTGATITGDAGHHHIGTGLQTAVIFGSGIPFAHAAKLPPADSCAKKRFIFQNGPAGKGSQQTLFDHMKIVASDDTTTIPLGVCWNAATDQWLINATDSTFYGDSGATFEYLNNNNFTRTSFGGRRCGLEISLPVVGAVVQKVTFISTQIYGASPRNGTLLCESSATGNAQDMSNLSFIGAEFISGRNCFQLAAYQQIMLGVHFESCGIPATGGYVVSEGDAYDTHWTNPQAAGGASVNGLFKSSVRSTIDYGGQRYTSAGNFVGEITGKGSPNGAVYAGNGSVYYRTDASGLGHSPCYKTGGVSNTGWVTLANTAC
jgi:hypothetical protein